MDEAGIRSSESGRRPDGEGGASAVEFAILLPLLVTMVFGLLDFALILNANLSITNAAHEGARASALGENEAAVKARVLSNSNPLGASFMTDPANPQPTVTTTNPGCATAAATDTTVTVTYTIRLAVPMPGITTVAVSGRGVERCFR